MTKKNKIRAIQRDVGTTADGIIGDKTLDAIMDRLGIEQDSWSIPSKTEVRSNKSVYGKAGEVPLKAIVPPYTLYYSGAPVKTITVHELIAPLVLKALNKVLDAYGEAMIKELGLDIYDGCYNNRSVRGGSATSMHAWGIALDFNAERNGNHMGKDEALFAKAEYAAWWEAWESVGARSFGKANGRDYMHVEFVTV